MLPLLLAAAVVPAAAPLAPRAPSSPPAGGGASACGLELRVERVRADADGAVALPVAYARSARGVAALARAKETLAPEALLDGLWPTGAGASSFRLEDVATTVRAAGPFFVVDLEVAYRHAHEDAVTVLAAVDARTGARVDAAAFFPPASRPALAGLLSARAKAAIDELRAEGDPDCGPMLEALDASFSDADVAATLARSVVTSSGATFVHDFSVPHELDVCAPVETWSVSGDALRAAVPGMIAPPSTCAR